MKCYLLINYCETIPSPPVSHSSGGTPRYSSRWPASTPLLRPGIGKLLVLQKLSIFYNRDTLTVDRGN